MEKPFMNIARKLKFINPDLLSISATALIVVIAFFYSFALAYPVFLIWAVILFIVRLILNKLDGAIVLARGNSSLFGKVVNALSDRYSDAALILGIALSSLCSPVFSLLGLTSIFLVNYTGLLGKALGADWQNQGPLGKNQYSTLVVLFTLFQFILLVNGLTMFRFLGFSLTPLEWCMILFLILGQITVFNRVQGINKQSVKLEWLENEKYKAIDKKILIAYDSSTGNTERVAEEISNCLKVGIRKIDDIKSVETYDLVIFGSRDTGNQPSPKIIDFINKHPNIKNYAVFITYKNPILGIISTQLCFSFFKRLLNKSALAVFSCKAAYAESQQFQGHPAEAELLNAFLFGIKLARKVAKIE